MTDKKTYILFLKGIRMENSNGSTKNTKNKIYMGMAVQPSLFMLKKDKFKLNVL